MYDENKLQELKEIAEKINKAIEVAERTNELNQEIKDVNRAINLLKTVPPTGVSLQVTFSPCIATNGQSQTFSLSKEVVTNNDYIRVFLENYKIKILKKIDESSDFLDGISIR